MERTPHFAYQHAGQYWLTGAIRRAGIDTSDMETATIVWFDGYCYNQVGMWWVDSIGQVHSGHGFSQPEMQGGRCR